MSNLLPVDQQIKDELNRLLNAIGAHLGANVMAIVSPIYPGLENRVRTALAPIQNRKKRLAIVLETSGGIVEVVERMVLTIRHMFEEVIFIVPNRAMSAGTVFVMSGDIIYMDYFSCLGPIDPQIEKDNKLIPALSYLLEFERLNEKAAKGKLTSAEYALLDKLDLAELHNFKQAKELSIELIERWLSTYKFKNWMQTKTNKHTVTEAMKKKRAKEIAELLSKNDRWHSHGRSLDINTLQGEEFKLEIENLEKHGELNKDVVSYYGLLSDYIRREKHNSFIHSEIYF